jgi:hypothetical protein
MNGSVIQKRNLWIIALFLILTGGFYFFYWLYVTKQEINKLGGQIPSLWFAIFPFLNIYFDYWYAKEYLRVIRNDEETNSIIVYFLLILILPMVAPFIIQNDLNKRAL